MQLAGIFAVPAIRHGFALGVTLATAAALFGLQLCVAWRGAATWSGPRRWWMLLAMAVLTYLPLATIGVAWPGMAGFLAGSILLLRRARSSWALFALIMATMFVAPLGVGLDIRDATYVMIGSLSSGLTVFAIYQLRLVSMREHGAGAQLAQLTSVRERERFSRDLHDILGYSLSAITLKAELTKKLVSSDPAQARDELAEVVELARQAAADVRLIASGYSSISLAREAASAASLLSSACITPKVAIDCGVLDDKVDAVLAIVLREAVTNVLRHSAARNCAIEASQEDKIVTLSVVNDGIRRPGKSRPGGQGLHNLAQRLEAVGGTLTTGANADDQFTLSAVVPTPGAPGVVPARTRHDLSGSQRVGAGKSILIWRHVARLRLKIGQGEQDGQIRRSPGAQLNPGGNVGIRGDRHRAGPADEQRPARPRLGVRVVRYCHRTEEPRPMGHPRQLK